MANSAFTIANGGGGAGAVAATQAQLETGTDITTFASPGRQQFHQSATKAWAMYATDTAIAASYNVTSNTDNGLNDHTIAWTTDFSSVNYCCIACPRADASDTAASSYSAQVSNGTFTAGTARIYTTNSNGNTSVSEPNYTMVSAWGTQV